MAERTISLTVNGQPRVVQVEEHMTLLTLIRENLKLTGTKEGCGEGDCGACSVILGGELVNACLVLAVQVDGKELLTIEGVGTEEQLHPIQQAFIDQGAVQCGYCTPGMVLASKALLDKKPNPSEEEIRQGLSGNLCRCTGYQKIVDAVKMAAQKSNMPT
jgi:aerobic carbon-monoxide dehydrogenase small subunit